MDVFAVQDTIATEIVRALAIRVTQIEQRRVLEKPTENLEAYDYVLRARPALQRPTRANNAEARALLRRAVELDPKYAAAHSNLGAVLADQKKLDEAIAAFRKAIELDPKYAGAHHNLGTVLRHLRASGPRSRARIATETGLNKATVSSLVAELEERGLVRDGDIERGQVGRPGQTVEIDGRVCGLGVELGIDHISTHVLDLRGVTVATRRIPVGVQEFGPEQTLGRVAKLIDEITVETAGTGHDIVGVAVGVPGLVETAHGVLRVATNLGWRDINVVDRLMSLLHGPSYPILLDNDANLAAVAVLPYELSVPVPVGPERAREAEADRRLHAGVLLRSELPGLPAGVVVEREVGRRVVVGGPG